MTLIWEGDNPNNGFNPNRVSICVKYLSEETVRMKLSGRGERERERFETTLGPGMTRQTVDKQQTQ